MNQSPNSASRTPGLDAFLDAAEHGEYVTLKQEGADTTVIAIGRTASGRKVAWIDDSVPGALPPGMATATAAFLGALEGSCGTRIRDIVSRELDMPRGGQPLPSTLVQRAVHLAKASQSLFAGSNFMTRLAHSAKSDGAPFLAACDRLDRAPSDFGPGRRALTDMLFAQAFDAAAKGDTVQIEDAAAADMLTDALRRAAEVSEAHAAALADPSDTTPTGGGSG